MSSMDPHSLVLVHARESYLIVLRNTIITFPTPQSNFGLYSS